jgi:hypothetical protein
MYQNQPENQTPNSYLAAVANGSQLQRPRKPNSFSNHQLRTMKELLPMFLDFMQQNTNNNNGFENGNGININNNGNGGNNNNNGNNNKKHHITIHQPPPLTPTAPASSSNGRSQNRKRYASPATSQSTSYSTAAAGQYQHQHQNNSKNNNASAPTLFAAPPPSSSAADAASSSGFNNNNDNDNDNEFNITPSGAATAASYAADTAAASSATASNNVSAINQGRNDNPSSPDAATHPHPRHQQEQSVDKRRAKLIHLLGVPNVVATYDNKFWLLTADGPVRHPATLPMRRGLCQGLWHVQSREKRSAVKYGINYRAPRNGAANFNASDNNAADAGASSSSAPSQSPSPTVWRYQRIADEQTGQLYNTWCQVLDLAPRAQSNSELARRARSQQHRVGQATRLLSRHGLLPTAAGSAEGDAAGAAIESTAAHAEAAHLRQQVAKLTRERDAAAAAASNMQASADASRPAQQQSQRAIDELTARLSAEQAKSAKIANSLQERIANLEAHHIQVREEMRTQLTAIDLERHDVVNHNNALQAELAALRNSNPRTPRGTAQRVDSEVQQVNGRLQAENSSLRSRLAEYKGIEEALNNATSELRRSQQQHNKMAEALLSSQEEQKKLHAACQQQQHQMQQMATTVEESQLALHELKARLPPAGRTSSVPLASRLAWKAKMTQALERGEQTEKPAAAGRPNAEAVPQDSTSASGGKVITRENKRRRTDLNDSQTEIAATSADTKDDTAVASVQGAGGAASASASITVQNRRQAPLQFTDSDDDVAELFGGGQ